MCGICGIRRFGDHPIPKVAFDILLLENQRRGNHATGVAIQSKDGSVHVFKDDVPAWNLVGSRAYSDFMTKYLTRDALTVLGHCRWYTKGDPKKNENNHPMFDGVTALVHNGHIGNDDFLFGDLKLKRAAETDSDILRAILDEYGFSAKGINMLDRCSGSAAIAAVSTDYPGELFLARSGNPLEIAGTRDYLIFSSERGPIKKAYRPVIKKFGVLMRHQGVDLALTTMNNDSAWIFGAKPKDDKKGWKGDWLRHHQGLRIATHFTARPHQIHENYWGFKARTYDLTKANVAKCPNSKCGAWVLLKDEQSSNIKNLKCRDCGTRLVKE